MLTPFRQQLLLRGGRHFSAPDQQGLAVKQLGLQLSQRVCQDINAPALLSGDPGFQPQARGIVNVPADHQCIFAVLAPRRGKTNGDVIDEHTVEYAEQRLQRRLRTLQATTERDEKVGDQRLRRIVASLLFDPRPQALQVSCLQEPQQGFLLFAPDMLSVRIVMVNIANWFNEIIARGAFEGCDFTDVLLFVNHDASKIPLARSRRNNSNSTMQLSVDDIGLFMGANIDYANNSDAHNLYSAVSRGDISGMSFCFQVAEDNWDGLDTDM